MTMSLDSVEEVPVKQYTYLTTQLHVCKTIYHTLHKMKERMECWGERSITYQRLGIHQGLAVLSQVELAPGK